MTPGLHGGAELLAVAADPIRWTVLTELEAGGTCVCNLQERIPIAANLGWYLRSSRDSAPRTTVIETTPRTSAAQGIP